MCIEQEREYIEKYGPKTVTIQQPEKKEEIIKQESGRYFSKLAFLDCSAGQLYFGG